MRDQVIGPETRALFTTRRWLDTMLALLLTVVALTRAAPLWTDLNAVEHVSVVACVGMVCAGAIFGSNPALLWLCPAGLMALPAAALFAPHGSPAWIPMPNAASYADRVLFLADGRVVDEMFNPTSASVLERMKAFDSARI